MTIVIQLFGPLRVSASDGANMTPRSTKARGMIALLASSATHTRSRTWLQSKLWSDRGREQAAASLRQVLTETRKTLGAHAYCLRTDRVDVSLVNVAVEPPPKSDEDVEFLEGIDIRDEEFEDWLRVERSRHAGTNALPAAKQKTETSGSSRKPQVLLINETHAKDGMEHFFSQHFSDSVARSVAELLSVDVSADFKQPMNGTHLVLRTTATLSAGLAGLRVSMEGGRPGELLWSGSELVQSKGTPPIDHENVLRLVNNAAEGIIDAMYGAHRDTTNGMDAHALARRAVTLLFSMERSQHVQADGLLEMAFQMEPRGVFLAWRAMLRIVMLVEAHDGVDGAPEDEALDFAARAFEIEPLNSVVLAAIANTALILEGDIVKGQEFAERAVRVNPANPFALDALSIAALYHGDVQAAHNLQKCAKHISGNTQFSHWFDMGCSMTATIQGDFESGLVSAQRAAAVAPSFRPPLRYLIALYIRAGDFERAQEAMEKLKSIEPEFSPERLWDDADYPVRDLRRNAPLLKAIRGLKT
ncbi:MAG: hypothetical protein AAFU86_00615 [Pseudomonadota bacterium]